MASINQVEPYAALADVYQPAGFADYSAELAPRLLDMAFSMEWTGRSLYDMACGTGDAACWFGEQGFRVIGTDLSPHMLRFGTARAEQTGISAQFVTGDIRTFDTGQKAEMVTCLGSSLNYVPTLRDLESVFRQAQATTNSGKLFIFDLFTIQGLARRDAIDRVLFDNGKDIFIVMRESFNYETLQLIRRYTIMRYTESGWQRAEETHLLRGYPIQ